MTSSPDRRGYLDWLRGLGVLIMIEAHTLDSWTRLADRGRPSYRWALVIGGFGAPIFLFLAGIAMVLAVNSRVRRGMSEAEAGRRAVRRAWQVFGLAFLFRLQSVVISGGGMRAFLKVDILNVMGVAMLVAAWIWRGIATTRGRIIALTAATVLAAMLTPPVRSTPWLGWLPDPLEAYVRPQAGRSTFTLFPWAGFLFAGALAGLWLESGTRTQEQRLNLALLAAGAGTTAAGYLASLLPSAYAHSEYWTSSPTFFFVRLGILMILVPFAFGWVKAVGRPDRSPLIHFGVASLFVYWIHVEMVYGVVSTPLHRTLSFEQALIAMAVFCAFLLSLVRLKQRWGTGLLSDKSTQIGRGRPRPVQNRPQSG